MYVCMYVCIGERHSILYVHAVYLCVYLKTNFDCICCLTHLRVSMQMYTQTAVWALDVYVFTHIHVYIYIYVCIYMYIYIHTWLYIKFKNITQNPCLFVSFIWSFSWGVVQTITTTSVWPRQFDHVSLTTSVWFDSFPQTQALAFQTDKQHIQDRSVLDCFPVFCSTKIKPFFNEKTWYPSFLASDRDCDMRLRFWLWPLTGVCIIIAHQATVSNVCFSALKVTDCSKRFKKNALGANMRLVRLWNGRSASNCCASTSRFHYCDLQNNSKFDRPLQNAWMRGIPIKGPFFILLCSRN
jgi:hypothetical protein